MSNMHSPPQPGEVLWELHLKDSGISLLRKFNESSIAPKSEVGSWR